MNESLEAMVMSKLSPDSHYFVCMQRSGLGGLSSPSMNESLS